jgi:hypothetical protein
VFALENNMSNNEWYEYSSEEMQHLGDEPGDVIGLILHDDEPENDNDQDNETHSPQPQESKLAMPARDKLTSQISRTYRDCQVLLALRVRKPRQLDFNKSGRLKHYRGFSKQGFN